MFRFVADGAAWSPPPPARLRDLRPILHRSLLVYRERCGLDSWGCGAVEMTEPSKARQVGVQTEGHGRSGLLRWALVVVAVPAGVVGQQRPVSAHPPVKPATFRGRGALGDPCGSSSALFPHTGGQGGRPAWPRASKRVGREGGAAPPDPRGRVARPCGWGPAQQPISTRVDSRRQEGGEGRGAPGGPRA